MEIKLWNVYKMRLTLNQKMPTAPVAAQTPIFPRNNTKSPTLLMAATRRTLLTKVMKAWKVKVPNLVYQNLHLNFYLKKFTKFIAQSAVFLKIQCWIIYAYLFSWGTEVCTLNRWNDKKYISNEFFTENWINIHVHVFNTVL